MRRFVFVYPSRDGNTWAWGKTRSGKEFDFKPVSRSSMVRLARVANVMAYRGEARIILDSVAWFISIADLKAKDALKERVEAQLRQLEAIIRWEEG